MTYMRSWKSLRLTSHTWLGLNPQIGRPLSRIVVPLVCFFLGKFMIVFNYFPRFLWLKHLFLSLQKALIPLKYSKPCTLKTKTRKKNKFRSSTVMVLKMFLFWNQKCSLFEKKNVLFSGTNHDLCMKK
jgi:hypothetical protein